LSASGLVYNINWLCLFIQYCRLTTKSSQDLTNAFIPRIFSVYNSTENCRDCFTSLNKKSFIRCLIKQEYRHYDDKKKLASNRAFRRRGRSRCSRRRLNSTIESAVPTSTPWAIKTCYLIFVHNFDKC